MPGKHPKDYSVDEVCLWLNAIELGAQADAFRKEGVDGGLLVSLGDDEFKELGLSGLQAKKAMRGLEISKGFAAEGAGSDLERIKQLEEENKKLQDEVDRLQKELLLDASSGTAHQSSPYPASAPAPPPKQRREHHVIKGAAGGAAGGALMGAVVGAVSGDARKGAKIGAATGAAAGGLRGLGTRRRARMAGRY
jgi:hypothetical protein